MRLKALINREGSASWLWHLLSEEGTWQISTYGGCITEQDAIAEAERFVKELNEGTWHIDNRVGKDSLEQFTKHTAYIHHNKGWGYYGIFTANGPLACEACTSGYDKEYATTYSKITKLISSKPAITEVEIEK